MQLKLMMSERTLRAIVSSMLGVSFVLGGLAVVLAGAATESVKTTINDVIRILDNQDLEYPGLAD